MSMTAYWTIRARLLRVPGVANVAIWNERLKLMTVQAEATKMQARQVSREKGMAGHGGLRPAQVLHRRGDRHRGHHRDAEPADRDPQRAADHHPGRPGQGARHRLGAAPWDRHGGRGAPAAEPRRGPPE